MILKRLHHKLVIYVLIVAGLLAAIAVAVAFISGFNHSKHKTEVMLSQLMDTVERTAAIAAYANDTVIAGDVINGLLRNDIVHQAAISNDQGLLVEKHKSTSAQDAIPFTRLLYSPFSEHQKIGRLVITPEAQFNLMEARYAAFSNAFNSMFLIVATTLILLLVVRANISRPLLKVSDTLHAIKAGKETRISTLKKHKHDELGRLINDINDLLKNLEHELKEEQALRKAIQHMEKQLRHIFESTSAGLFLLDSNGKLLTHNPTLLKVMHSLNSDSTKKDKITGCDFASFFLNERKEFKKLIRNALQSGQLQSHDFSLRQSTTTPVWVHCLLSKVIDSDGEPRIEGVAFDVSQRVITELAIKHKAEHDPLTGLLLRHALKTRFDSLLSDVTKPVISVFFLDLDGFKQVNDNYGHDVGDKVLIKVAERLKSCVRSTDLVARLGGDEFLIIIHDNNSTDAEISIAEKMIHSIQSPIQINSDISIHIGVSIGIANYPRHGLDCDELIISADEAMYEVKRQGKNGYGIRRAETKISVKLF